MLWTETETETTTTDLPLLPDPDVPPPSPALALVFASWAMQVAAQRPDVRSSMLAHIGLCYLPNAQLRQAPIAQLPAIIRHAAAIDDGFAGVCRHMFRHLLRLLEDDASPDTADPLPAEAASAIARWAVAFIARGVTLPLVLGYTPAGNAPDEWADLLEHVIERSPDLAHEALTIIRAALADPWAE